MPISIPSDHLKLLSKLAELSPEQLESITASAAAFKSGLILKRVEKQLQDVLESLGIDDAALLSRVLLTLHMSYPRSGESLEVFVEDIVCQVDKQLRDKLRDRLRLVLQIKPIALSVKASSIQVSYDRVYNSCFIATDIRPIFADPVNDGLAGSMIVHQMRMTSMRNRKQEDLYFALDDTDLLSLSSAISRALEKSKQLRLKLDDFKIPQVDGENK